MKATPNDQTRNLNFKIPAAMYRRFRLRAAMEDMMHVEYLQHLMDIDEALQEIEAAKLKADAPGQKRSRACTTGLTLRVWAALRNKTLN